MNKKFIIIILLFTMHFAISQSTFYIQNGNSVSKVENGDPSQLNVSAWQVRLYKRGASKSGNNYWGKIEGGSANEVMQKLRAGQEFELKFNAFIGKGRVQDPVLTNFNPLGPIAITDASILTQSPTEEKIAQTSETYNKAGDYLNAYFEAKKRLDVILKGKTINPFDNYGSVFKEYTSNLKDAIKQTISLRTLLLNNASVNIDRVEQQIASIDDKFEKANTNNQRLNTLINENQSKSDGTVNSSSFLVNQLPLSNFPNKYKIAVQTVLAAGREISNIKASIPPELTAGMNEQQKIAFKNFVEDVNYYSQDMFYCFGLLSPGSVGYGYLDDNQVNIDGADQYYRDKVMQNDQILQSSNYNTYYSSALLEKGNAAYDLFKLLSGDPAVSKALKNKILQYGITNVSMIYQQAADGYQDASVVKDKQALLTKLKQNLK
jgi:hypothetical protein